MSRNTVVLNAYGKGATILMRGCGWYYQNWKWTLTRYESSLTDGICVGEKRFLKSLLLDVEVVSMLFSRLSILSGDGCDWWLHVKVVCGRYASFCGNMGFGGGEGGNIAWIFPEQSLNTRYYIYRVVLRPLGYRGEKYRVQSSKSS